MKSARLCTFDFDIYPRFFISRLITLMNHNSINMCVIIIYCNAIIYQPFSTDELKRMCLDELEGMSRKRIEHLLDGTNLFFPNISFEHFFFNFQKMYF